MIRGIAMASLIAVLALVVVWEVTVENDTVDPVRPQALATEPGKPAPALDTDALAGVAEGIMARPLLAPNRRPPDQPSSTGRPIANAADRDLPRLTGTIVGPSGGWAIFASTDGRSRSVAEGEKIGAFKVRKISPGVVNLTGSDGEHILRPTYVALPSAGGTATPAGAEAMSSGAPADVRNRVRQRALFPDLNAGAGTQERPR
jgi:hypothetical protein